MSVVVLLLLLAWLVALVWAQGPGGQGGSHLRHYLAPQWGLFTAPLPWLSVTASWRLETDAGAGPWQPLPAPRARSLVERLWGPERRIGKINGDLVGELTRLRLTKPRPEIAHARAYLVLLDQARAAASGAPGRVRFCLRTEAPEWPEDRSRIVFLSEAHEL